MRFAFTILIGLSLLQGTALAVQGPEIQVVDGKVTMSAQAVPLGQLLTLLDRATGLKSEVLKPELSNRNISVRFTQLEFDDAVAKIFEGQPLNYMVIQGKGIRVFDLAQGGTATSSPVTVSSPSFQDAPVINPAPFQPAGQIQPVQPANVAAPPLPANTNTNNPFGNAPNPNPNATPASGGPGQIGPAPGQITPFGGGINPLSTPAGTGNPNPTGGFPGASTAPPTPAQPSGPGTIGGGATPGAVTPGQVR